MATLVKPRGMPALEKLVSVNWSVRFPFTSVSAFTRIGVSMNEPKKPACNRAVEGSKRKSVTVNGELVGMKSTPLRAVWSIGTISKSNGPKLPSRRLTETNAVVVNPPVDRSFTVKFVAVNSTTPGLESRFGAGNEPMICAMFSR